MTTTPAESTVSPKVTASTAAAAVVAAVATVAELFGEDVDLPVAPVGAALTLAVLAAGYFKRDPLRR